MSEDEQNSRVTLAAVAAEAGVSLATISKVLNGRPDVAAATRERVEALLSARGYERRVGANGSRGELIELVFHELQDVWSMEIIAGVESVAQQHGLSLVLTASGTWHAPDPEWIEGAMRRRPVGSCWSSPIWRRSTGRSWPPARSRS